MTGDGPLDLEASVTMPREQPREQPRLMETPARIGRYEVRGSIGRGGAGVVYEAHDPELDRVVAIKLLLAGGGGSAPDQARLLREAQALARISDPHVVPIYDVGVTADTGVVYLVMERVQGEDMRVWIGKRPRVREVVSAFVAAGRGLASAHAAGVVHRDFKPSNVFIGKDGRVRVGDFGLARPVTATDRELEPRSAPIDRDASDSAISRVSMTAGGLSDVLTEAGVIMGTPAFMAPEQHEGAAIGPAADQYAFCVSMFWALFGRYPFEGKTHRELAASKRAGVLPEVQRPSGVPRAVLDALARGLAPDPDARHRDIAALVDAIEHAFARARLRRALAGVAIAGAAAAIVVVALPNRVEGCRSGETRVAELWNEGARERVSDAITAAGTSYSRDAWQSIEPRLDAYAGAWVAAHADACEGKRGSDVAFDATMRCLDRRLDAFASVLDILQTPGQEVGLRAVEVTDTLGAIADCGGDPDDELGPLPRDERLRELFLADRGKLDRVRALLEANDLDAAETLAKEVEASAVELGFRPLETLAILALADVAGKRGNPQACADGLERGALAADALGLDALAAEAKADLAFRLAHDLHRPDEAARWLEHAEAANARAGGGAIDAIHLLDVRATIHLARGEFEPSRELLQRSVDLADDPSRRATQLGHLGVVENILGNHAVAAEHHLRARELLTERYGPDHPQVAYEIGNEGLALAHAGRLDEASAAFVREADMLERAFGADHPEVATAISHLADIHQDRGEHGKALELVERALAINAKSYGTRHPSYARALYTRGMVLVGLARHDDAIADFERAVGVLEDSVGHEYADLVHPLGALAQARIAAGHAAEAVAPLRRAIAVFERAPQDPGVHAILRFDLARALWKTGERDEALREAQAARAEHEKNGDTKRAAAAAQWLATPE